MDNNLNQATLPNEFNEFGEAPIPDAPIAVLENSYQAVPQQYFHYWRTLENVEQIVSQIEFSRDLPIFVFTQGQNLFLQVGIIGHENYPPVSQQNTLRNEKIVYGRRWYIEPYMPTSEVVQTAYLAINKVREHELREFFSFHLRHKQANHTATTFNTHLDLPLAAANSELFTTDSKNLNAEEFKQAICEKLTALSLSSFHLTLDKAIPIDNEKWVLSVSFKPSQNGKSRHLIEQYFPELIHQTLHIISRCNISNFLHELMAAMIKQSEDYVAENFTYNGFKRFSKFLNPDDLARFSIDTRLTQGEKSETFKQTFQNMIHLVDSDKAPSFAQTKVLADKQQQSLENRHHLEGYLPK